METREKIYRGLKGHRGSIATLADRCSCTPEWVRLVLSGREESAEVLEAASALWLELEEDKQAKSKRAATNAVRAEELANLNYAHA